MSIRKGLYIVAAKRTPYGAFGGKLKDITATDLQVISNKAALAACSLPASAVDSVVVGNVMQSSKDAAYLARHAALKAGIPNHVPAVTINRLCGSGFESVIYGCREILVGDANIVLTGGTENMSQAPYTARNMRWGTKLGQDVTLEDTLWAGLTDSLAQSPMGVTAENLADKYGISREECDQYALESQQRWKAALDGGFFNDEIAEVPVKPTKGKKGVPSSSTMNVDEHPRPDVTMEGLAKLPAVFKKEGGTVTAGNASGICDGAGTVIVANEAALKENNLTPLARIVGWNVIGCDPKIMGIGPAYAIQNVLKQVGKRVDDIDLFEVNEAFAPQYLSVAKEAGLPRDRTNVHGGAIALGHPLGASGSRIMAHLTHALHKMNKNSAIGSACIGGGQGIAIMIERC